MSMDSLHLYPGNLFLGFVHLSSSGIFFFPYVRDQIFQCKNYGDLNYILSKYKLLCNPKYFDGTQAAHCTDRNSMWCRRHLLRHPRQYIPLTAGGCPDRRRSGTGGNVQDVVRVFGIVRPSTSVIALCKVSAVDTP